MSKQELQQVIGDLFTAKNWKSTHATVKTINSSGADVDAKIAVKDKHYFDDALNKLD